MPTIRYGHHTVGKRDSSAHPADVSGECAGHKFLIIESVFPEYISVSGTDEKSGKIDQAALSATK